MNSGAVKIRGITHAAKVRTSMPVSTDVTRVRAPEATKAPTPSHAAMSIPMPVNVTIVDEMSIRPSIEPTGVSQKTLPTTGVAPAPTPPTRTRIAPSVPSHRSHVKRRSSR